jgi:hypothetical protein
MRHDFIFEVLEDLRTYAAMNGLMATVAKVDEALRIAHAEVAMGDTSARIPPPSPSAAKRQN